MVLKYIFVIITIIVIVIFAMAKPNTIQPIDIVYTWVEEHDPERDVYKKKYNLSEYDGNDVVYRYNNFQELKYSIRSLFKYCGDWIGNVYIVVKDGQKPKYLDFTNPRLILVKHSEIMPEDALPTFNSNAIELCICKIKNLRDIYVYFNDDMFVNKRFEPISPDKRIKVNILGNSQGRSIINYTQGHTGSYNFIDTYSNTLYYARKIFNTDVDIDFPHSPSVCYKPWEIEMENILIDNNIWLPTVLSRFRNNTNIIVNNCFRTYFYLTKKHIDIVKWNDTKNELKEKTNCKINYKPFFAVNEIPSACGKKFKKQMEDMYSRPSLFERGLGEA